MNNKLADYLSLFAGSGTIICCALPALLVSIGAGANTGFPYFNISTTRDHFNLQNTDIFWCFYCSCSYWNFEISN